MRVLVCGGRDYEDSVRVNEVLDEFHSNTPITLLIEGGARGADSLADRWAVHNYIPSMTFNAEWDKYGKAAGMIRNQKMLDVGKPDVVIAFPGGRGTSNMVNIAEKAKVRVIKIS
jgi:hypothetical protein